MKHLKAKVQIESSEINEDKDSSMSTERQSLTICEKIEKAVKLSEDGTPDAE